MVRVTVPTRQTGVEVSEFDQDALAGASSPDTTPVVVPFVKEIFPLSFDKDYMDFRPEEVHEEVQVPKDVSAPGSASERKSVTGLEDVSSDDLQTPSTTGTTAPMSAETASSKANPPETGKPTS